MIANARGPRGYNRPSAGAPRAAPAAVTEGRTPMRDNPLKKTLAAGGRAAGAFVFEFMTPALPQLCRNAGADFVIYDMEHTGVGFETIRMQMALCRGQPIVPLVRVPRPDYHFVARALDVGALGIMVPMVASAAEAAHIVACTRYPPEGRRGAAFGFAHDDFEGGEPAAKVAALNARTLVIAQIETTDGLANVDAIAATPGVDVLFLGHFDLTNFMGIPGQFRHPDYLAALERIVGACAKHGKTAGFLAADDDWARDYLARGFRMIAYGIDHLMLQEGLRRGLSAARSFPGRA